MMPQVKHSKKLVSADNHSNIFNFHYTYLVTLVPVCKDDLVLLPKRLAEQLGNISRLVVAQRITSAVLFTDPLTAQTADVTEEKVWTLVSLQYSRAFPSKTPPISSGVREIYFVNTSRFVPDFVFNWALCPGSSI